MVSYYSKVLIYFRCLFLPVRSSLSVSHAGGVYLKSYYLLKRGFSRIPMGVLLFKAKLLVFDFVDLERKTLNQRWGHGYKEGVEQ